VSPLFFLLQKEKGLSIPGEAHRAARNKHLACVKFLVGPRLGLKTDYWNEERKSIWMELKSAKPEEGTLEWGIRELVKAAR